VIIFFNVIPSPLTIISIDSEKINRKIRKKANTKKTERIKGRKCKYIPSLLTLYNPTRFETTTTAINDANNNRNRRIIRLNLTITHL